MASVYTQISKNNQQTVLLILLFPLFLLGMVYAILYFIQPSVIRDPFLCQNTSTKEILKQKLCTENIISDVYQVGQYRHLMALEDLYVLAPLIFMGAGIWISIAYFLGDSMILHSADAKSLLKSQNPEIYRLVENVAITAGLPMPKVYIINDESLNAFATGRTPETASIALTTGIIKKLNKTELEAVIAHEMGHIGNRDIRLMLMIIVGISFFTFVGEILFRLGFYMKSGKKNPGPFIVFLGMAFLVFGYFIAPLIRLAISRRREFLADSTSALLTRNPEALASALQKISQDARVEILDNRPLVAAICIAPPGGKRESFFATIAGLYKTHPPVEERIKALLEMVGKA